MIRGAGAAEAMAIPATRVVSFALLPYFSAACALIIAALRTFRLRSSIADGAFVAGMAVLAAESVCAGLVHDTTDLRLILTYQSWRLTALSLAPGIWMLFAVTYARGRLRQSRVTLAAALILPLLLALWLRQSFVAGVDTSHEEGARPLLVLDWPGFLLQVWLLIGAVVVLMNLERTYRASVGLIRWRIKFMLLAVGLIFGVRLYTTSQVLLFRGIDLPLEGVNSIALLLACPFIAVSIFRSDGREPDVYPSHSVLQSSATVLLAGIYLLVVGVFAKIVTFLGGGEAFALKAFLVLVALVSAAVLLQSDRARVKLRKVLSRHFQRPLFDYRKVWRNFTECSATRVEQDDLARSMTKLVAETFDALSVSLWLVDDRRESLGLGASTFLSDRAANAGPFVIPSLPTILEELAADPDPVDLDSIKAIWAGEFRAIHPQQFTNGGHRMLAPLVGRREIIGFIIVGDRVGGSAFDAQDIDLLKSVSDHISSSLLNIRLSQRLLQAKELEAFQTMATFFVHDLKNAASTLNLMLRNLPVHFDDPEFRQDALRGMGKTVSHINSLISRLSLLRNELKLVPVETSLGHVIDQVVGTLDPATQGLVRCEMNDATTVRLDIEQIAKVLTNLLINAREALPPEGGEIIVRTAAVGGWVSLTVSDNGCGISPEFLRTGLFRPFQTTKKNGLGIGMFQSKMIIEAHGGRIEVTSEPGSGTTFRILLPTPSAQESAAPPPQAALASSNVS